MNSDSNVVADRKTPAFRLLAKGPGERAQTILMAPAAIPFAAGLIGYALLSELAFLMGVIGATLTLMAGNLAWAGSRHGQGEALITDERLDLQLERQGTKQPKICHRYRWEHIESAEVLPFDQTGRLACWLAPLLGQVGGRRVVVLRLRNSVQWTWHGGYGPFGTDVGGISSGFIKQVVLSFQNPDAFVAAVEPFLTRANQQAGS